MSVTQDDTALRARYWIVPALRCLPALGVGLWITFSQDHSARLGLFAFGGFAVLTGIVLLWAAFARSAGAVERAVVLMQAAVGLLAGATALVFPTGGLPVLLQVMGAWAAVTGFLELYLGLRSRRRHPAARDWILVGALGVAFAVVALLLPPDYSLQTGGTHQVDGLLTASVIAVGAFGAYAALVGVFLAIAALSLKWGPDPSTIKEARP